MGKDKFNSLSFPRFILPSYPNRWRVGPPNSSSPPHSPNSPNEKYLDGHVSFLRCTGCATHICWTSQIISKGFTGRYGRAYLVSADLTSSVSVSASSSPIASLPNTYLHEPVPRQLITGAHTVSDVICVFCESVLGWKYVAAEEESQRYKVGKFILETRRITSSSCWESPRVAPMSEDCRQEVNELHDTDTEFDSQDEDECEDLFAGIWSPGLASRRRCLRIDRRCNDTHDYVMRN